MFSSKSYRAVAVAMTACATMSGLACGAERPQGTQQSTPGFGPEIELASTPLYDPGPSAAPVAVADRQQAEPVLVPLPPGAWAAMSGLMGLAAVAAWRKHRLREE